MKIKFFLFFIILSIVVFGNTKYITYIEHETSQDEFNLFHSQRAIKKLVQSPDGLIIGGTGGISGSGNAILFYYDPSLPYSPSDVKGGNPRSLLSVQSDYSAYHNILGITLIQENSIPDTIYFVIQGSYDTGSTIPYKICMLDYEKIHDANVSSEYIDLGNSPNGLKYITGFSNNDTYLAIAGDPGSGGKIEFFNIKTNSFINTSVDILSVTSNRDYRALSLTSDGQNFFAGTLTINNPAEILKIDKNFNTTVLFQPDISYFDNVNTAYTVISALHIFNNKLYAGTESPSSEHGGMIFYYDLLSNTPKLLGKATNNTHTYGIQAFTGHNGEIYGSTKAEYDKTNVNNKNSWGRIFKISENDSITETNLIDYRGEFPEYNPAIIPTICSSWKTNDIIFGTEATDNGTNYVNYGGLMGKTDFYPPSVPKCLDITKKDKIYHVKFAVTGDDYDLGNASYYEIKGALDRIVSPIEYMSLKTLAFSPSSDLKIGTLYYPFFYFKAYDNVMNVSSMGVIENNFYTAKIYPNPVKKGEILNILFPASTEKIKLYTIAGVEVNINLIDKGITADGYKLFQLIMADSKLASGTYIFTGETLAKKTYYLKFSYIK